MRTFRLKAIKFEKGYVIAYIVTIILAIITGIVLCVTVQFNPYMQNYASEYIYFVYNFRTLSLFLPCLFYGLVYGYVFFFIGYCTKLRWISLPILFLRGMIGAVYAVLIISVSSFGGVMVAVFVFIPSTLVSLFLNVVLVETVRFFNKRFAPFLPTVFALAGALAECLLLNVLFRVVIAIA
mgnify:FL=1